MRRLIVGSTARRQFVQIVRESETLHGAEAADRYRRLIVTTFQLLLDEPDQPAAHTRAYAPTGLIFYHLRHVARAMPVQDRVRRPRHFIVYRHDEHQLEVVRLLHDAMDLPEQFN